MIDKINSWTGQIVIATVVSIIIQMILPNGKNKKYAEVVSGLYILYVILNPILNIDNKIHLDIQSTIAEISNETYISQEQIARTYIIGLENNLKSKIEENGYSVEYIQFYVTTDYSMVAKIEVKMKYGTKFDENKVKDLVLENFEIGRDNINVF